MIYITINILHSFYHIKFKTTYLRGTITNTIMKMKKWTCALGHLRLNIENQHLSLGLPAVYFKGMKIMLKVMQQFYTRNRPNMIVKLFILYSHSNRMVSRKVMLFLHYKVKENNFTYSRWVPQYIFSIYSFWYKSWDKSCLSTMPCLAALPWLA